MLVDLSDDLCSIEKQIELVLSRIQYTAIGWIWESLTCPKRFSFIFLNARRKVPRGFANLYGHTLSTTINKDDTAFRDIRNTVLKFGEVLDW